MKNILTLILSFASVTLLAQVLVSAKPETAGLSVERLKQVDQMINGLVESQAIPGAVVLIARNGKIVYHNAYGYSDAEAKKPMQKDNIFRIASQSKAIASLAAMILWEEGKFQLDDPVSRYIPEFKNPTVLKSFNAADTSYTTDPAGREITIRHLLTHTSGIDYAAGVPSGIGNDGSVIGDKIKILATLPLKHKPGERWTYGLNTDVIGYLIEIWSGMSFDQFLRKRIFDPLGMNNTWFYLPAILHNKLVQLYSEKDGKIIRQVSPVYDNVNPDYPKTNGTYYSGGAGLSSTVEDYAKFLHLFLNFGKYNGVRIISRKTVELMLTNQFYDLNADPYGLAFGLETVENDHKSVESIGTFRWGGAFNTHYWADPKEQLIGLIFTNMYNASQWSIGSKFKVLTYQSIND
ncbi:MAG: beta-lactamase family protein [Cyclobacteriaceae bacterium]|nr:beta-lactamase family protein [Cyclobacteriaceae bacterium]